LFGSTYGAEKLNVLIVDGQNNHGWMRTTPILKWILEESGRFNVEVSTSPGSAPRGPQPPKGNATDEQKKAFDEAKKAYEAEREAFAKSQAEKWAAWKPDFKKYHVVVSNYNGQPWPDDVKSAFLDYVRNGGGFVSVHAANNAFAEWSEYNEMIGLGGWGGRNEKFGPYIRYREGKVVRDETPGGGGKHGKMHEFVVETREPEHPIMKGLPLRWKHTSDELYSHLRGPAKNLTVLATAFSAPQTGGSNEHEPMLMTIQFGKGRVFHTTLGHAEISMYGIGFQATLNRGTEWAATGAVTLPVPEGLNEAEAAQKLPPGK
jgi:type 1 glutamine amidotransferase